MTDNLPTTIENRIKRKLVPSAKSKASKDENGENITHLELLK